MLALLVGTRIKDVRNSLMISQEDLSRITGIERTQISKIENGNANITLETIERLSIALKLRVADLFDESYYKKPQQIYVYNTEKLTPFVKWAGGKTQILGEIKSRMPINYNSYFEPFVGGGALFFHIAPQRGHINDSNLDLISAYRSIKDDAKFNQLITKLEEHERNHSEQYYYQIRDLDREEAFNDASQVDRAARMIYLNKACFNGLYRVNSKGFFNVPSGKKKTVKTFNREALINIHNYLASNKVEISSLDFEEALVEAEYGDFVYFDPPYDVFEEQSNFTSYSKESFGRDEQKRLLNVFEKLSQKGAYLMLSNHNTSFIRDSYKKYNMSVINAKRMINSDANNRGNVEELIITNY
ncbi:MAG: Dam family site-specific DNA-(adenine-N6)-methyltransferase [Clostridia bacterium]|jgi:DNA adenine methylase|nr:Dam family site-specific DNA-(adenine-N6)-methyltransferase [Clostridia bacterium]